VQRGRWHPTVPSSTSAHNPPSPCFYRALAAPVDDATRRRTGPRDRHARRAGHPQADRHEPPALPTPPRRTCFGEPATIAGSSTINGTSGDDVIIGSPSNDAINGLGGDDTICGLAGSDQIAGGCSGRGPGTTSSTADSVVLMTATARLGTTARQAARSSPASRSRGLTSREMAGRGGPAHLGCNQEALAAQGAPRPASGERSQRRHGQAMQRCRSRPASEVRGTQAPRRIYSRQATIGGWDA
jgi:RTX calcium-binding nonapeptide repeat (4 copies)